MTPSRTPAPPDLIDACMEALQAAIESDPVLSRALRESWKEFWPRGGPPSKSAPKGSDGELAARRHLEWFLLEKERPGPEEARIEALIEACADAAGGSAEQVRESLAGSHASVFEVKRAEPGRGVWLWDLAGLFECATIEAEGSRLLEAGDVIAGRVFPTGDSFYRLSRAAAMWRDPRLLSALERDMERARANRPAHSRGSLRLRQSDLESMFQPTGPLSARRMTSSTTDAVADARTLLTAIGVEAEAVEDFLARLANEGPAPSSPLLGAHDVLGDILEELAFESSVDLEAARRVLLLAWEQLHVEPAEAAAPASIEPVPEISAPAIAAKTPPDDVAAAVAEFDRKRRAGAPLEVVFQDLERDLGLADGVEGSDEEDTPAPDFPGVVAAMIEEFLWDEGREHGPESTRRYSGLRSLGKFTAGIGVFENLSGRELSAYACRWLPASRELTDAAAARDLLEALGRFCAWAQENHEVRLEEQFTPVLRSLEESLPRLVEANRRCPPAPAEAEEPRFELVAIGPEGEAEVADESGDRRTVELAPKLDDLLRPGDLLRGKIQGRGTLRISACFPSEARRLELA